MSDLNALADLTADNPQASERDLLATIAGGIGLLVSLNTPGIPGIRGAQEVPELSIERRTLTANSRFYVPGNYRRRSLSIQNVTPDVTLYVMDDAADPITQGFPIGPLETFTIDARAALWLETDEGTADIALCEVSS